MREYDLGLKLKRSDRNPRTVYETMNYVFDLGSEI